MKPLEGADAEGALGFFKGVGKGFVGYAVFFLFCFSRLNTINQCCHKARCGSVGPRCERH